MLHPAAWTGTPNGPVVLGNLSNRKEVLRLPCNLPASDNAWVPAGSVVLGRPSFGNWKHNYFIASCPVAG